MSSVSELGLMSTGANVILVGKSRRCHRLFYLFEARMTLGVFDNESFSLFKLVIFENPD